VSQGLSGLRRNTHRLARERKQERFAALLHHVTVSLLKESFDALKKNAAPRVDAVTGARSAGPASAGRAPGRGVPSKLLRISWGIRSNAKGIPGRT
jgi:hypothetical protein